ncbi:GGDEF domain-containing protein [Nitrincola tapanii]|uniref:diguanylate cyclase n=1 Tax=Nitrincola tapanii TaxID=1708751 RepID=A0A5A9W0B4_9GAMM|nr:sensor domain-containing diguanylate cyclase [Nitrincola tapanii]KAA0874166.1 diguanylate cyclase [Nitrincola tapanii]
MQHMATFFNEDNSYVSEQSRHKPGNIVLYLDQSARVIDYQVDPDLPLWLPKQLPCPISQFLALPSHTLLDALSQQTHQLIDLNLRHRDAGRLACRGWLEFNGLDIRLNLLDQTDLRKQLAAQETRLRWLTQSHEVLERLLYVQLDQLELESERLLAEICRCFQLPAAAIFMQDHLTQKLQTLHCVARELPTPEWFDPKEFLRISGQKAGVRQSDVCFWVEQKHPTLPSLYMVMSWPSTQEWQQTLQERGTALMNLWLAALQQRLHERALQESERAARLMRDQLELNWCEFYPERHLFSVTACSDDPLSQIENPKSISLDAWWQWIVPSQREGLALHWQESLLMQAPLKTTLSLMIGGQQVEYAFTLNWLQSPQGIRGIGCLRNIQQEIQVHQEAEQVGKRMSSLLETTPALIYVQSYEQGALSLSYCNAGSDHLLGWSEEAFCQQGLLALLHPEDRDLYAQRNQQLFQNGQASSQLRLRDAEGEWHHLLDEARLVRDPLGVPVEVVAIALDVTDLQQAQASARHYHELSIRDPLTGVNNPRFLQQQLQVELARAQRSGEVFSLCLLDLDKFKSVNDTYGHLIGDEVLVGFARIILESLRIQDLAFRYGGEEFVLLLPNTELQDACLVAERLRETLEETAVSSSLPDLRVTVSIGVSEFRMQDTALTLMERADQALYAAKESGRNQVKFSA